MVVDLKKKNYNISPPEVYTIYYIIHTRALSLLRANSVAHVLQHPQVHLPGQALALPVSLAHLVDATLVLLVGAALFRN